MRLSKAILPLCLLCALIFVSNGPTHAQGNPPDWSWVEEARSPGDDQGSGVAMDNTGNMYVCGSFSGSINTDLPGANYVGGREGVLAKYSPLGTLEWAISIDGTGDQECLDVAVGPDQNVYVCGYFENTANFTGTSPTPTFNRTGNSHGNLFIAKYNPAGNVDWITISQNDNARDEATSLVVHEDGVYVTGFFQDTLQIAGIINLPSSNVAQTDGFLMRLDTADGTPVWGRRFYKSSGNVKGLEIASDQNRIFAGGIFDSPGLDLQGFGGSVSNQNLAGGTNDLFVTAYSFTGVFIWVTPMGSTDNDTLGGLDADADGLYVTGGGSRGSSGFFIPALPSQMPANQLGQDIFIAKLHSTFGIGEWATTIPDGSTENSWGADLYADQIGNLYICGGFHSSVNLGGVFYNSMAFSDAFASKLTNTGTFRWTKQGFGPGDQYFSGICGTTGEVLSLSGTFFQNCQLSPFFPSGTSAFHLLSGRLRPGLTAISDTTCLAHNTTDTLDITTNDVHPMGGALTVTITLAPGNGTGAVVGESIEYVPTPGFAGQDSLVYQIKDTTGDSSTAVVYIYVNVDVSAGPNADVCGSEYQLNGTPPPSPGNVVSAWKRLPGGGTFNDPFIPNAIVYNLNPGVNSYLWKINYEGCADSSIIVLTSYDSVTAVAGLDTTVCGTSATLNADTMAPGSGSWFLLSGAGSLVNSSDPHTSVNGLAPGPNEFIWEVSNVACLDNDTVTVTSTPLPVANAGPDSAICGTTLNLSGNPPASGAGIWTVISGTGIFANASQFNTSVSGLSIGTNVFQWTLSDGACSDSDQVTITADTLVPAVAGVDSSICGTSIQLYAQDPTPQSGLWEVLSGGGTLSTPSQFNATVSGMGVGANNLHWIVTNGACADTSTLVITTSAGQTANAGADSSLCGNVLNFNGNPPTSGSGLWSVISGAGTFTNPTLATSSVTGLSPGPNTFQWELTDGACITSDQVTITVDTLITAFAGIDTAHCGLSLQLFAQDASPASGLWQVLTGAGSFVNDTLYNTLVSGLIQGANTLEWQVTNGSCSSRDTLIITAFDSVPTPFAGPDQQVCGTVTTLNATPATIGTGGWSLLAGGSTITNTALPNSGVTGLTPGNNRMLWTVSNGVCEDTSSVNVVTFTSVTANPGTDDSLCGNQYTLNATPPAAGAGQWRGPGLTFDNNTLPGALVSGLTFGPNILTWRVENGACVDSAEITITAFESVIANAGTDDSLCGNSTQLNAQAPPAGTGTWSVISSTGSPTINNLTQANTAISNLTEGTHRFQWKVENGICTDSAVVKIISYDSVFADAGPDLTTCTDFDTLAALTGTASGVWNLLSGAGNLINPTQSNTVVSGLDVNNTFVWTLTNGLCTDADTTSITVISDQANGGPDQITCILDPVTFLPVQTGTWIQDSGAVFIPDGINPNRGTFAGVGMSRLIFTYNNGTCETYDTVRVTIAPEVTPANAGPDQTLTVNDPVLLAGNSPVANETGQWSAVFGPTALIQNPSSAQTSIAPSGAGAYGFRWRLSNGLCPATTDEVVIVLTEQAVPLFVPDAISPNNDTKNDAFVIDGLENTGGVDLFVYNRWGNLVYEAINYQNDWSGTSLKGDPLSDDTYYYVLDLQNGEVYKGFVVIKR